MCTGEMKYVILRIDTHVLRIDLCPRNRTRIRRQKQDEDVHLFLSERKKARPQLRQGPSLTPRRSWPDTRRDPNARTTVGAYCIRPPNRAARPEWDVPGRAVGPVDHSPGRNPGRRNPGAQRHTPTKRASGPEWDVPGPPRVSPWAMIRRPYRAHGYPGRPDGPPQQTNGPQGPNIPTPQRATGPNNINRAARPPTHSELWTQKRITRTCSSSCCSS